MTLSHEANFTYDSKALPRRAAEIYGKSLEALEAEWLNGI